MSQITFQGKTSSHRKVRPQIWGFKACLEINLQILLMKCLGGWHSMTDSADPLFPERQKCSWSKCSECRWQILILYIHDVTGIPEPTKRFKDAIYNFKDKYWALLWAHYLRCSPHLSFPLFAGTEFRKLGIITLRGCCVLPNLQTMLHRLQA